MHSPAPPSEPADPKRRGNIVAPPSPSSQEAQRNGDAKPTCGLQRYKHRLQSTALQGHAPPPRFSEAPMGPPETPRDRKTASNTPTTVYRFIEGEAIYIYKYSRRVAFKVFSI